MIKKFFMCLLFVSLSTFSFAQSITNVKISEDDDRVPKFGFAYSKDNKIVYGSVLVKGKLLAKYGQIKNLYWAFYNKKTSQLITEWESLITNGYETWPYDYGFNIGGGFDITTLVDSLHDLQIVLYSSNKPIKPFKITHLIDLGSYCYEVPENFINSDNQKSGCTF
jgi:hypothetical protein